MRPARASWRSPTGSASGPARPPGRWPALPPRWSGWRCSGPPARWAWSPSSWSWSAGSRRSCPRHSYALLLQMVPDDDPAAEIEVYRQWWIEGRVDGVLLCDVRADDPRVPAVAEMGLPAVVIGPPTDGELLPSHLVRRRRVGDRGGRAPGRVGPSPDRPGGRHPRAGAHRRAQPGLRRGLRRGWHAIAGNDRLDGLHRGGRRAGDPASCLGSPAAADRDRLRQRHHGDRRAGHRAGDGLRGAGRRCPSSPGTTRRSAGWCIRR